MENNHLKTIVTNFQHFYSKDSERQEEARYTLASVLNMTLKNRD